MVAFQTSNKKSGIKNVAIWVEILQLQRYTIAVIMKMRMRMNVSKIMRISKALRKKVYMLTSFYAGICTNFRYLKTMVSLKNTDLVTRELSKDFFSQLQSPNDLFISGYLSCWVFEFLTLIFFTSLTGLKQDARYDFIYAPFYTFTW